MDAKQACDKLNGFNFQGRYLVGTLIPHHFFPTRSSLTNATVLYHQPDKMAKSENELAERQENLEQLKREHGIE